MTACDGNVKVLLTLSKGTPNVTSVQMILNLSLPVPRWAGDNTDLPSNSNISKTVTVNIAFTIILKSIG